MTILSSLPVYIGSPNWIRCRMCLRISVLWKLKDYILYCIIKRNGNSHSNKCVTEYRDWNHQVAYAFLILKKKKQEIRYFFFKSVNALSIYTKQFELHDVINWHIITKTVYTGGKLNTYDKYLPIDHIMKTVYEI